MKRGNLNCEIVTRLDNLTLPTQYAVQLGIDIFGPTRHFGRCLAASNSTARSKLQLKG